MHLKRMALGVAAFFVAIKCVDEIFMYFHVRQFRRLSELELRSKDGEIYFPRKNGPLGCDLLGFLTEIYIPEHIISLMLGSLKFNLDQNFIGKGFNRLFKKMRLRSEGDRKLLKVSIGNFLICDLRRGTFLYKHNSSGRVPMGEVLRILRDGYERFWISIQNIEEFIAKNGSDVETEDDAFNDTLMVSTVGDFIDSKLFWFYTYLCCIRSKEKDFNAFYQDVLWEMLDAGDHDLLEKCFVPEARREEALPDSFVLLRYSVKRLHMFPYSRLFAPPNWTDKQVQTSDHIHIIRSRSSRS